MKSRGLIVASVVAFGMALDVQPSSGAPAVPLAARAAHADKNKDGVVTRREIVREKQWERHHNAKVDTQWEKKADIDKDGKVEWQEFRIFRRDLIDTNNNGIIEPAERIAFWKNRRAVVNTPLEKKYDRNADGFITWNEAREFLKNLHTIIKTHGKARVNSPIEQEFDINNDGMIDETESVAMLAAIAD